MTQPFHPVFPNMGWSCINCRRSFGFYQLKWGCTSCYPLNLSRGQAMRAAGFTRRPRQLPKEDE